MSTTEFIVIGAVVFGCFVLGYFASRAEFKSGQRRLAECLARLSAEEGISLVGEASNGLRWEGMWQEQPIAFHYRHNTKQQSDYLAILVPVTLKYPFYLKPIANEGPLIAAAAAKAAWEISIAAIADERLAEALIRSCDDPRFCSVIASDVPFDSKFVTLPEESFDPAKHKYRNEEKRFTHLILLLAAPQDPDAGADLQFTGKFLATQIELLVRLKEDLESR